MGFSESWITAHVERGQSLGWYNPQEDVDEVDPQRLRTVRRRKYGHEPPFQEGDVRSMPILPAMYSP